MEKVLEELRKLSKQWDKVNEAMEEFQFADNDMDLNDYIVEKYPFNESFDETVQLLDAWIENIEESIKK